MRTTGIFETTSYEITFHKSNDTVSLFPFGDVHYGAPGFSEPHWREFVRVAKSRPNAHFIGMGDYWDFASASERKALRNGDLHESTQELLAGLASQHVLELHKQIDWMRGRVIGIVGGNHTYEFEDGTTADYRLAQKLECPFLGVCGLVRLVFKYARKTHQVYIAAHHGVGGYGKTTGAQFNSIDDFSNYIDADIFLMGDNHGRGVIPSKNLRLVPQYHNPTKTLEVRERQVWLARTGSFLRAYVPGKRSYIVEKCKAPSNLGFVELQFSIRRNRTDGADDFDIQVRGIN